MWGKHWPLPSWAAQSPCSSSTQRWGSLLYECEWGREVKVNSSISKLCNLWHSFFPGPWNLGMRGKPATLPPTEGRASAIGALGYCAHKDCASGAEILTGVKVTRKYRRKGVDCALRPTWARGPPSRHAGHCENLPPNWVHQVHAWSSQ